MLFAEKLDDVHRVLHQAESRAQSGFWVVGYVSYDAAPAFDAALTVPHPHPHFHSASTWPLVWFGVFDAPLEDEAFATLSQSASPDIPLSEQWQPSIDRARYHADIRELRERIRCGEAYQINHTFRLHNQYNGDAIALYERLRAAQVEGYCAYLSLDDFEPDIQTGQFRQTRCHILSLSPELFFHRQGNRITTRPMKGTAPRGRWSMEDQQQANGLRQSEKNRAENLMIVDLLRNDLSRIAQPHSVTVNQLFAVEPYPTLWQMTSTVQATTRPGTTLDDIFSALFPCGSVTGAPKTQAMSLITQHETEARGIYCGAIGLIKPGGDAIFNVAIRTLTLQNQQAICGIGGGITWDSNAEDEYGEAMLKARFLSPSGRTRPQTSTLIETLRLEKGRYWLLERHLERLKNSAHYFNRACDLDACRHALKKLAYEHRQGLWRVRLDLEPSGKLVTHIAPFPAAPQHPTFVLSQNSIPRHADWVYHKTTDRDFFEQALSDAQTLHPNLFDVLLWNEAGELTEFTRGNLVVEIEGIHYTPPQDSGLLDGVLRRELLETGQLKEKTLTREDLDRASRILFINSLRGEIEIHEAYA